MIAFGKVPHIQKCRRSVNIDFLQCHSYKCEGDEADPDQTVPDFYCKGEQDCSDGFFITVKFLKIRTPEK